MSDNIEGIIIGHTLYTHQNYQENRKMVSLIKKTLDKNEEALLELKNFPNGGAASSYDLGYVITQIIYRLGEEEIVLMVEKFPNEEKTFEGLIDVGLEYGDNDYDGKRDNKRFNNEFPKLFKYLDEKH
ncbi:hypothetical protein [Psychroserpens algicola]|uniref:DUF4325 domain-containing protein n=1 Tax=Psychroserpens algicola TaxID=1719034 RepID=A0ABT0H7C5_9FLAO|nr:hypothetical protein [Psychroserpens algicola]MCK8480272.1 hypothetical protein [Psychroserpens algicola]